MAPVTLEDKFEVIKEVGDGSFGSVALARVRTAGAHVARRGTMVKITRIRRLVCRGILIGFLIIGRYQNDEKDIRIVFVMPRPSGSHIPAIAPHTPSFGSSPGYLPGPS